MNWFSTSFPSHEDEVPAYCAYCLINFKKYNEVINNICQECGRVHQKTREDKQPLATISSINAPPISETEQSILKGVYLEIDTSPLITQDETKQGINSGSAI